MWKGIARLTERTLRLNYEQEGDSYEVTLNGIYLPDSKEELNAFEASLLWTSFYN